MKFSVSGRGLVTFIFPKISWFVKLLFFLVFTHYNKNYLRIIIFVVNISIYVVE